jgi:hypothetical protein
MSSLFTSVVSYLSKACGLESVSSFPSGHAYARTHWNPSYFDIPYGMKPEQIERSLCTAIGNTPSIFLHIANPTPRMQRALLAVVAESLRRNDGRAGELAAMLIAAYASPYVEEAVPGLRAEILQSAYEESTERVRRILSFLSNMQAPFDVIEAVR